MDDTLYTRQKKEQNRIKKIYKNLPKEQLEIAKKLIERAAYMLVSLEDMEAKINEDGLVVKMPQGAYTIERAHPLLQPYNAMVKNYNATIKREPAAALDVDGSVMMNGFNVLGLVATLDGSEDLNNLVAGGIYTQALNANASTEKHYPKAIAGFLEVMANPSGYIMQRYTAYDNSAVYVRTRYDNKWYAWKSVTLTTV